MKQRISILTVAGARPNFMKIASLADAFTQHNTGGTPYIDHVIIHTGQHYDRKMSELFFRELGIPEPGLNLEVGSASHAVQTAEIMKRFEPVVLERKPDYVLVVGDVNSTIACALVAVKLGVRVIHVEAGLRSFDRSMPEEINRVLTDAISDILFTTERTAEDNLLREGVEKGKIHFVGNTMIDTLLKHRVKAEQSDILRRLGIASAYGVPSPYALVTLHRPSNVDRGALLREIFAALNEISRAIPLVFPIHPRTRARLAEHGIDTADSISLVEPLGYLDFIKLQSAARMVLTDSGGVQEEATVLGVPCFTLRETTERPVTLTHGTNTLVTLDRASIVAAVLKSLEHQAPSRRMPELWDGQAARRIVAFLCNLAVKEPL